MEPQLYTYILSNDGKTRTFKVFGTEDRCQAGLDRLLTMGWKVEIGLTLMEYKPIKETLIVLKGKSRLNTILCYLLVHCPLLWNRNGRTRWNWIDSLLYWLEGLR